jgi:integrase
MGHVQDRWFTRKPDPARPGKSKPVPTGRNGIGKRYRARYFDNEGIEQSRLFADGQLKVAKEWLAKQEAAVASGTYVDPKGGKITVDEFAPRWIADLDIDELSRQTMEMRFRKRVLPYFGKTPLGAVKPSAIRSWDSRLRRDGLSDRYRHTLFGNVSAMFTAAKDDGLIGAHPMEGKSVKAPKVGQRKVLPWPEQQVWDVRHALLDRYKVCVDLAAGLGLRQGECFGLAVEDVDHEAGEVRVTRQVKIVRHQLVFAPPKYDKERTVPLASPVGQAIREHLAEYPTQEVTLPWERPGGRPTTVRLIVLSAWGRPIRGNDFNREYWKPALKAAGVPFGRYENGIHDLRHFFASVLLDSGESIKAVAEWLGHSDPSFTLKIYTHLMPNSVERTQTAINQLYGRSVPGDGPTTAQTARDEEKRQVRGTPR